MRNSTNTEDVDLFINMYNQLSADRHRIHVYNQLIDSILILQHSGDWRRVAAYTATNFNMWQ